MKFRVYETVNDKDVTDERDWYIDTNGYLCYRVDDMNCAVYMADGQYYYKMEIFVFQ